jgi:hypothetical protein
MADIEFDGGEAERSVREAAGSEPMRIGARAGLVANGLMHLLVAWLAVRVAGGGGGRADQAGALQAIAGQPFGALLVWLVAAAFVAVIIWRLREAVWGFRYLPRLPRLGKRLFAVGQVLVYGGLAVLAGRVAAGAGAGSGGQGVTAVLLRVPGGRWLVVLAGAVLLVVGGVTAVNGWRKTFVEDMDLAGAGRWVRALAVLFGRAGAVARGVAFAVIGVLVILAALTYQPARAEGMDAALRTLAGQPYGPWLLGLVAAGLACYGVFCFFDARYHRV